VLVLAHASDVRATFFQFAEGFAAWAAGPLHLSGEGEEGGVGVGAFGEGDCLRKRGALLRSGARREGMEGVGGGSGGEGKEGGGRKGRKCTWY
jgi:hypothetical protein